MKRLLSLTTLGLLSVLITWGAGSARAQVYADRIAVTGVVTDSTGAAVPNATVTITNGDTGVKTVLVTNASGNYTTPALVLGPNYTLEVRASGFKTYTRPSLI